MSTANSTSTVSPWLSVRQGADYVGVSVTTLKAWFRRGLKAHRPAGGRRILVHKDDIDRFVFGIVEGTGKAGRK